jgi:hypothetical protein
MPRKPNPELIDEDAPEARDEWFQEARATAFHEPQGAREHPPGCGRAACVQGNGPWVADAAERCLARLAEYPRVRAEAV